MHQFALTSRVISFLLAAIVFLASCSSTTVIRSEPPGAKLYLNGELMGTTPYAYTDTKITGSVTYAELRLEGHEPLTFAFARNEEADVGAIIGGFFFLFPLLWVMKYKPFRTYELIPLDYSEDQEYLAPRPAPEGNRSATERLRNLKALLDGGLITEKEYEQAKAKVLEEY